MPKLVIRYLLKKSLVFFVFIYPLPDKERPDIGLILALFLCHENDERGIQRLCGGDLDDGVSELQGVEKQMGKLLPGQAMGNRALVLQRSSAAPAVSGAPMWHSSVCKTSSKGYQNHTDSFNFPEKVSIQKATISLKTSWVFPTLAARRSIESRFALFWSGTVVWVLPATWMQRWFSLVSNAQTVFVPAHIMLYDGEIKCIWLSLAVTWGKVSNLIDHAQRLQLLI